MNWKTKTNLLLITNNNINRSKKYSENEIRTTGRISEKTILANIAKSTLNADIASAWEVTSYSISR